MIKIAKYLSQCGVASRRKAEDLIKKGKVKINGKINTNTAERIDPEKTEVEVFGKKINREEFVYYLLYKPVGYTTTTKDPHAERLITELVPKSPKVWPVGRLDKNTSGAIILTNDGEFTQRITHPKYEKEKEYSIETNQKLSEEEITKMQKGLMLEDGFVRPVTVTNTTNMLYLVSLTEGRNRIVRRMFEKVGKKVAKLKRIRIGSLELGNLQIGQWRKLTKEEINKLKNE